MCLPNGQVAKQSCQQINDMHLSVTQRALSRRPTLHSTEDLADNA